MTAKISKVSDIRLKRTSMYNVKKMKPTWVTWVSHIIAWVRGLLNRTCVGYVTSIKAIAKRTLSQNFSFVRLILHEWGSYGFRF